MLRLAFDFIITWRETRTRPNAYFISILAKVMPKAQKTEYKHIIVIIHCPKMNTNFIFAHDFIS